MTWNDLGLTSPGGQVFLATISLLLVTTIWEAVGGPWPNWAKNLTGCVVLGGLIASVLMPMPL